MTTPLRVKYYAADKAREIMLARAMAEGIQKHGDVIEIRRTGDYGSDRKFEGPGFDTDVAMMFGVKGKSREILKTHRMLNLGVVFMDKGWTRGGGEGGHTEYTRCCVNASHPNGYFQLVKHPSDRFDRLGIDFKPRQASANGHVLVALNSQKYANFHGLGDAHDYAVKLISKVRKQTARHIVYRPKPSWDGGKPIPGSSFSSRHCLIGDALRGCHVLITHGATAAMDAIIAGVPAIAIGHSIASPVCGREVETIEDPFWPSDKAKMQWAYDMAYTQWTNTELRSGVAWEHLKAEILRQRDAPVVDPETVEDVSSTGPAMTLKERQDAYAQERAKE